MLSFLLRLNENMYHTMSRHFGLGYQTGYPAKAKRSSANRANVPPLCPAFAFILIRLRLFAGSPHLSKSPTRVLGPMSLSHRLTLQSTMSRTLIRIKS